MKIASMGSTFHNAAFLLVILAAITLLTRNFSGEAMPPSTAPARHYYLTKTVFNGNQPLTACSQGYHFASFAEISDPAVLTYNQTLGRTNADDGAGPPSAAYGWVRSGYLSNSVISSDYPTNCSLWTSAASTDGGTVGLYSPIFNVPSTASSIVPVVAFLGASCDNSNGFNIGVWCVEN